MNSEHDAQVIAESVQTKRTGWAEAAMALTQVNVDELVMGDFPNEVDEDLAW